jgi:hypothetical protein
MLHRYEEKDVFLDAQQAYSKYAVRFNWIYQLTILTTLALSAAGTIIYPMQEISDVNESVIHLTDTIIGAIVTTMLGFVTSVGFKDLSHDCERISILIDLYVSGLITDETELRRLRGDIITRIRTTRVLWFRIPQLALHSYAHNSRENRRRHQQQTGLGETDEYDPPTIL